MLKVSRYRPLLSGIFSIITKPFSKIKKLLLKWVKHSKLLAYTLAILIVIAKEVRLLDLIKALTKSRITASLSLIGLVLCTTIIITQSTNYFGNNSEQIQKKFIPSLNSIVNDVNKIKIMHKDNSFDIVLKDDNWQLPSKNNYPASIGKIRRLVSQLDQLGLAEKKTDNENRYSKLGVENPSKENRSIRLKMLNNNETLVDVIIGNIRKSGTVLTEDGIYVRKFKEKTAWLAKGKIDIDVEAKGWIDRKIISISPEKIKEIHIGYDGKNEVKVVSSSKDNIAFTLADAKPEEVKDKQSDINNIAMVLTYLEFEEALPISRITFDAPNTLTTKYTTHDGLEIIIDTIRHNDERWSRVSAITNSDNTDIKQEADRINALTYNWAYKLPEIIQKYITMKKADILKNG